MHSSFRPFVAAAFAAFAAACSDGTPTSTLTPSLARFDASASQCGAQECTMAQTIALDPERETITLPLYQGTFAGSPVYYIITESSDKDDAERLGVNYAPKLRNALGTRAVQRVTSTNGTITFSGTVRFASTRSLRAGPDGIPPGTTPPSSVGDANYSPLITTGNGIVRNASQVANASGAHDALVSIDIARKQVTLSLFLGFYGGHGILYLHMDASKPDVASVEGSNFASNLDFAPGVGSNDGDVSARSAIIPIRNGREARGDPERQGLNSFLANQGDPINVTQTFPGSGEYSPVWDIHFVKWRESALAQRERLTSTSEVINAFNHGLIDSEGTGPANKSLDGIRANDAISNCPVVARIRSVNPGQRAGS